MNPEIGVSYTDLHDCSLRFSGECGIICHGDRWMQVQMFYGYIFSIKYHSSKQRLGLGNTQNERQAKCQEILHLSASSKAIIFLYPYHNSSVKV